MLTLRPYQERGIADIRRAYANKKRAPIYVGPTGSGKTALFAAIAHGAAAKNKRVLILSHRVELIDQISSALQIADTSHGFIARGYPTESFQTMIASVPTLVRRFDKIHEPDLIIIDECHHARAITWASILTHWPNAKRLGVTATPMRPSGEALGTLFDELIIGPTVRELQSLGFLAPLRVYAPPTVDTSGLHTRMGEFIDAEAEALVNKPAITGSAVEHYRRLCDGVPALAFCVSIRHAKDVATEFRAAGYSAISLDGKTDRDIRRGVIADFRALKIQLLTSCGLFSEGFDCPGVRCGIMLKPTQSEVEYRQEAGRIMRLNGLGEPNFLIDHVNNTQRFGLPDEPREWSLTTHDRERKKKSISVRVCESCFSAMPGGTRICPECGYEFPAKPREVERRQGELVELTREEIERRQKRRREAYEQSSATTPEALAEIFRRRGYKGDLLGRARHVLAARAAKRAQR